MSHYTHVMHLHNMFAGTYMKFMYIFFSSRQDPGIGNLITFSQFFLIALQGFIFTAKCGTKKPSISVKYVIIYIYIFLIVGLERFVDEKTIYFVPTYSNTCLLNY